MKRILIIEAHDFHEEVILPQIEFLSASSYETHLFVNEKIKKKNLSLPVDSLKYIKSSNKLKKLLSIFTMINYIRKNKIDIIIYNTLEDKYISILNKFVPNKIKKIAIVHNVDELSNNKMDLNNFIVLSENVFINTKKEYNLSYFYPLVYNQKTNKSDSHNDIEKINIVIPGLVELSRRDYLGLIENFKFTTLRHINFIILGNISKLDGCKVYDKIKEYGLQPFFTIYEEFVPYEEYFSVLNNADLIMPLIHPNVDNYRKYHTTKISAAFSMGFSFKVPFLIYESLYELSEFHKYSVNYNLSNLIEVLENLNHKRLNELKNNIQSEQKFDFEIQKNKYVNFLESL